MRRGGARVRASDSYGTTHQQMHSRIAVPDKYHNVEIGVATLEFGTHAVQQPFQKRSMDARELSSSYEDGVDPDEHSSTQLKALSIHSQDCWNKALAEPSINPSMF